MINRNTGRVIYDDGSNEPAAKPCKARPRAHPIEPKFSDFPALHLMAARGPARDDRVSRASR
jgi:hypothetical protein